MDKEINKLLKKAKSAELGGKHKDCIEYYNIVGGMYTEMGSYEEAIDYHQKALDLCETIGDGLGTATANRFIGEAKAALGQFFQAIDHIMNYLQLADRLKKPVEKQRAYTTLGRVYLMQAQEMKEQSSVIDEPIEEAAKEADSWFKKALKLADQLLNDNVIDPKEFAQMKASLLVNMALVADIRDKIKESVLTLNEAVSICRSTKIKEDLYRCQILLASIHRQRYNIKMAVKICEEALLTAKSIGKKLLICDAYIEQGMVKLYQGDFLNSKRCFAQAYLEKSPNEDDQSKAIRLTKLTHLMTVTFDELSKEGISSETKLKLCDKLGDLLVAVKCYRLAVNYYILAYKEAQVCGRTRAEKARILYSMAETYADDGQFKNALKCYERELEFRAGNDTEQCQSLIKIAQMHEYQKHDTEVIAEYYEKALNKAGNDVKSMFDVLKYYVSFLRKREWRRSRYLELEGQMKDLEESYLEATVELEEDVADEALEDEVTNIEDIISEDEDNEEIMVVGRRKSALKKFKQNEVGDTPLHEACINGDLRRVKSLVAGGHPINPRDNAGWTPLHEACNHGHYEIVEFLIERGADVSNRGHMGIGPLHDAATNGHLEIMKLLIRNKANVIARTDSGETVWDCLQDYHNRFREKMSDAKLNEYNQMKAELLIQMERCGFDLMDTKRRVHNSANRANRDTKRPPSSSTSTVTMASENRSRTNSSSTTSTSAMAPSLASYTPSGGKLGRLANVGRKSSAIDDDESPAKLAPSTNSVKEYRSAIGSVKRQRMTVEPPCEAPAEVSRRGPMAPMYETSLSTSMPTKQWLIDDVSRASRASPQVIELDEDSCSIDWDDEDDGGVFAGPKTSTKPARNISNKPATVAAKQQAHQILEYEDDDDDFLNLHPTTFAMDEAGSSSAGTFGRNSRRPNSPSTSMMSDSHMSNSVASARTSYATHGHTPTSPAPVARFDLLAEPLVVEVDERRLMMPVRDPQTTVLELREGVAERYSVIAAGERPILQLLSRSCDLYDNDLCVDVIRERKIEAKIKGWRLKSLLDTYEFECQAAKVAPIDYVNSELIILDKELAGAATSETRTKLDMKHWRVPAGHAAPLAKALRRRPFVKANLTGCAGLLSQLDNSLVLNTVSTWAQLEKLVLRAVGLRRRHFEALCSRVRLPSLKRMNLAFNLVAYPQLGDFCAQVDTLKERSPQLERLDMSKNLLQFVLGSGETMSIVGGELPAFVVAGEQLECRCWPQTET